MAGLLTGVAAAADRDVSAYPNRPIRLLLGQAPGGGQDIIARALALKLTETFGQTIIVDNRPGAAGTLAAALAAKATADGYTALVVSITYSIVPALYRNLPFDPRRDLKPVTQIASTPFILLVNPALPVKSVKELIAYAKEHPREINYASGGIGNSGHLAAALFASLAGVQLNHVPYKGTGIAMPDLLSGRVQLLFNSMIQGRPYVQRRQLHALAVTTSRRSALLPELPTMAEAGIPSYEFQSWYGVMLPAGTVRAIVAALRSGIARTLGSSEFKRSLAADGSDAVGSTPEEFAVFLDSEVTRWGEVVKSSGMKAE